MVEFSCMFSASAYVEGSLWRQTNSNVFVCLIMSSRSWKDMALQMLGITDVTIGKIYATHGKRFTKIMAFHCHLTGLAIGPLIKCWIAAKRGSRQSTLKFLFLDFLHQEGSFCVYAVCVCVCVSAWWTRYVAVWNWPVSRASLKACYWEAPFIMKQLPRVVGTNRTPVSTMF